VKITTDHPLSSYGIPVILDDAGQPLDYGPGLRAVRARLGLSVDQVGAAVGKSGRTVESWESGRYMVPTEALYVLAKLLETNRHGEPANAGGKVTA
jgi:DNA-binding XRE family transcriptional regulator